MTNPGARSRLPTVLQVRETGAITYSGTKFQHRPETAVGLPWDKSVTIDGLGKTVFSTATNDFGGGTITCQISANGKTIAEQSSSGGSLVKPVEVAHRRAREHDHAGLHGLQAVHGRRTESR